MIEWIISKSMNFYLQCYIKMKNDTSGNIINLNEMWVRIRGSLYHAKLFPYIHNCLLYYITDHIIF